MPLQRACSDENDYTCHGEWKSQSSEETVLLEINDGCLAERTGTWLGSLGHRTRADGRSQLIFLSRLIKLGKWGEFKEQGLCSLFTM